MNSSLSYCDYIAHTIVKPALDEDSNYNNGQLSSVGLVKMDLHKKDGYMLSTTKRIKVMDVNGREYLITVEDITK
jgi:hypothetical protein